MIMNAKRRKSNNKFFIKTNPLPIRLASMSPKSTFAVDAHVQL